MFELLRSSVTLEVTPRLALFWWWFHRLPFLAATGDARVWVNVAAAAIVGASLGLDCCRVWRTVEQKREARYLSELRSRHERARDFDIDEDLF